MYVSYFLRASFFFRSTCWPAVSSAKNEWRLTWILESQLLIDVLFAAVRTSERSEKRWNFGDRFFVVSTTSINCSFLNFIHNFSFKVHVWHNIINMIMSITLCEYIRRFCPIPAHYLYGSYANTKYDTWSTQTNFERLLKRLMIQIILNFLLISFCLS